jgi:hypothetical protein
MFFKQEVDQYDLALLALGLKNDPDLSIIFMNRPVGQKILDVIRRQEQRAFNEGYERGKSEDKYWADSKFDQVNENTMG